MQQLPRMSNISGSTASNLGGSDAGKRRSKLPSPKELVSYYESRGLATEEASFKVIEDLQNALLKSMISSSARRRNKSPGGGAGSALSPDTSSKLDVINARLLQLDMKLDSKPGFSQTLAIGVASGVLLHGFTSAAAQVWAAVRRATTATDIQ